MHFNRFKDWLAANFDGLTFDALAGKAIESGAIPIIPPSPLVDASYVATLGASLDGNSEPLIVPDVEFLNTFGGNGVATTRENVGSFLLVIDSPLTHLQDNLGSHAIVEIAQLQPVPNVLVTAEIVDAVTIRIQTFAVSIVDSIFTIASADNLLTDVEALIKVTQYHEGV